MHFLLSFMVLVEALSKSPPVRQEANDPIKDIRGIAFTLQVDRIAGREVLIFVEAGDVHEMLQWSSHRRDDIGQEEVSESHLAER